MASRKQSIRFTSFIFFGLLLLLSIYQASNSYHGLGRSSSTQAKRSYGSSTSPQSIRDSELDLHSFAKRAPPETAEDAKKKAQGYWCKLIDPNDETDWPFYSKQADSDKFNKYWTPKPYGYQGGYSDTAKVIPDALNAKGLPLKKGQQGMEGLYYEQNEFFDYDGEDHLPTYGHYRASMSPQAGYISAEDNYSPMQAGNLETAPDFPTALSDVYFLMWQEVAKKQKKNVNNLKYFIRHHVVNTQSKRIALEVAPDIPAWPGTSFSMQSDEGLSILGTPNGAGVAFFLYQHKPELGVRVPTKVTLFSTDGHDEEGKPEKWYHFLFEIAPYSGKGKKGKGKGKGKS